MAIVLSIIALVLAVVSVGFAAFRVGRNWAYSDITEEEKLKEELRKAEETLKWIKEAKRDYMMYVSITHAGMCFHLKSTALCTHLTSSELLSRIPEFRPETFGLMGKGYNTYWWPINDTASRMKAFDTLIGIYQKKIQVLKYGTDERECSA